MYTSLVPAEHIDVAEYARRRRVPDADHLRGLALAAIGRAEHLPRRRVANEVEAAPERGRDAAVVRILHDGAELAVLDQPAALATELELVARVIDRPAAVR